MRICFINTLYYPYEVGGAEKSVQSLAETLQAHGHEVIVITTAEKSREYELNGVKVYALKLVNLYWPFQDRSNKALIKPLWHALDAYNPIMAKKVATVLDRECPDVVHTNNLSGFSVAVFEQVKKRCIPLVHTLRDHYMLCTRYTMFYRGKNCDKPCRVCKAYGWPRKALSRHVDYVVGISRFLLDNHLDFQYFKNITSSVIHNSYQISGQSTYAQSMRTQKIRFGFIGRIVDYKGVDVLIDAFDAADLGGQASLMIAGAGEQHYLDNLKQRAGEQDVRFLGYVKTENFFSQIDVLVVPSLWHEALGRIVIESYAYGIPVVVSSRGGLPEIVDVGATGFVFDPDNMQSLAAILEQFTTDRDLAYSMRGACLAKAKCFLPEHIVAQYLQVYESVRNADNHWCSEHGAKL